MFRRIPLIALGIAATWAPAQDARLAGTPLTAGQIENATVSEGISIPAPGELFSAFAKTGRPDWSAMLRKSPTSAFTSRPQIALNLGALIADGCLAAEAQDKQQLKNAYREIRALAKGLGLDRDLVSRSNSIADYADGGKWDVLSEMFDAVQHELAVAMESRHDHAFATLMTLGGWLRAVDVIGGHLATNYTPDAARALRQPGVGTYFVGQLAALPQKISASPMIAALRRDVSEIHTALAFPAGHQPSAEDVSKLKNLTASIIAAIAVPEK